MNDDATTTERVPNPRAYDIESEVKRRYGAGARQAEASLCCPTRYDADLLALLPEEVLKKDYGCGDPSRWVAAGETVLDLGSGAGKICYILAQKVGGEGAVLGVDFNDDMLAVARKYQGEMGAKLGYRNVRFLKGRIQDLALDLEALEGWLREHPVDSLEGADALERERDRLRVESPLIADASVDVVVSNCVLNLVRPSDKEQLFAEIHRVLRTGGRAVISDVVCDRAPTQRILEDPELWSGCISGAFREEEFLERFERAGFQGIEILERQAEPWQVIDGIEFRSLTVRAHKVETGACLELDREVIYRGPWKSVSDDEGHVFARGERAAVCERTCRLLTDSAGPYAGQVIGVDAREEQSAQSGGSCCCDSSGCC